MGVERKFKKVKENLNFYNIARFGVNGPFTVWPPIVIGPFLPQRGTQ
jgi:hypothetical protein